MNKTKAEQSQDLADDVAAWIANGGRIANVDHTANAEWRKAMAKRGSGYTQEQARADIAYTNGGFFHNQKKGGEPKPSPVDHKV